MPWTFAHPAAVLPLRRLCPGTLNFPALVAGTLAPDFGYYVGAMSLASFAHRLPGTLVAALPAGIALLALFYLVRRPLWYLLPEPHRTLLATGAHEPLPRSPSHWLSAAVSVLLGVWTHVAWDSFTHAQGWAVAHLPALHEVSIAIAGAPMPLCDLLQHASTVIGTAALVAAYRAWLHGQGEGRLLAFAPSDRWRYAVLATLAVFACALALVWAPGAGHAFVFHAAVYGAVVFASTLLCVASVCYACRRVWAPSRNWHLS